jgi:hypothetical protein
VRGEAESRQTQRVGKDMGLAIELPWEMFRHAYDAGWSRDDATRVIEVSEEESRM